MGFMSSIKAMFSKNSSSDAAKTIQSRLASYGINFSEDQINEIIRLTRQEYKKKNIVAFVSDQEIVESFAMDNGYSLGEPLEGYAREICAIFCKEQSFDESKPELRAIGEKINDYGKQRIVAYRAKKLCKDAYDEGFLYAKEFSIRYLEYAWDGIGGWMK